MNKSAFVRSLPNIPAQEVVAKAKAQGITLSDKYVYNIRAKAKSASRQKPGRPGRPKGRRASIGAGSVEQQLVDLALELGLSRAEDLLSRIRTAIRSAAGG